MLNTVYQRTATARCRAGVHVSVGRRRYRHSGDGAPATGKLVLDVPTGSSRVVVPPAQRVFSSDSAYIITGGWGPGAVLGRGDRSGRLRTYRASRSQPTPEALETMTHPRVGTDVVVECGDILNPAPQRLVATATATGLPVRGVLHAAAVVEDAALTNITDELIDRDWAPKVYGAWNLHTATADQPLDWFCPFSSAAALVGSPGQGAYAAANSWVDAFTLWRRAQGLPATAIAWGAWAQIGRATAVAESSGTAIAPDEGRLRVRSATAPRPRLHRLCADHGDTVVDYVRRAQPVRRSVPLHRAKRDGHKQTACRTR
jgi:polyketide synthase 5